MQLPWGGLESEAVRRLGPDGRAVRAWPGTAVISHEILATASRTQIARALSSLGHPDTEVHVVLSLRDLVRQIPAEWQENVKHRSGFSYRDFLATIQDPAREGRVANWFWGVQEIPDILNRWAADLPPERVHLVTVPRPGGPPDLLWERFCEAFGIGGLDLDLEGERTNPSLGVAGDRAAAPDQPARPTEAVPPVRYRPLVRELLAHQTLSRRTGSPRLTLPPDVHPWAQELAAAWIDEIKARGYHVVGDLSDLVGPPATLPYADPDHPAESEVADAAVDAIRALLVENGRLLGVEEQLTARAGGDPSRAGPVLPPADVPGAREDRAQARVEPRRTLDCCGSTASAAAGARGRRNGRPARCRSRRPPCRSLHRRSGSGARRSPPAACRPPWRSCPRPPRRR